MLDFVFGKAMYDKVMKDEACLDKFGTYMRKAFIALTIEYWIAIAIVLLVMITLTEQAVSIVQILLLALLWLAVALIYPLVQWKIWSRE